MRFYTVTKLGERTSLTPEGYLLAEGVPVARCGAQIYHHSELPLEPNGDGLVHVHRDPSEVFSPASVASFNLKPIVNDHPMDEVGPGNWNNLAIGIMSNPRQGNGADDDVLLADLLFTSPVGIQLVQQGKRAVSVGYDAHYEQIAPGMGRQKNIVCNHLALVDVARCGARCTIMDDGAAIYSDTWQPEPKPPVYQRGMNMLRKLLPVAWSHDVDYRQHEPIDWEPGPAWSDDDWNEALHPRVPAGSGHGGEFMGGQGGGMSITSGLPSGGFAVGGEMAPHIATVPTPKAAVVQKHGGSKKLAALVKQHLETGEDPHSTAEAIKAYGNAYVNAGYASYANALLKHVEEAHGLPTGSLGKSKAASPLAAKGPAPMGQPTAAEMQAMAEADEPAPDMDEEYEESFAVEPSPAEQHTALGKNAAGTDPETLAKIATDPAALNQLSDTAHKMGITVMGHVTPEAKAAKSEIGTWTDPSGYKMIQNHLNGTATSAHAAEVADKLQKAVLSTELLSAVNTYRGVHGPQLAKLASMMPGDLWTPKGFSATTLDPKRATHYAKGGEGGDLMHIVLPKGSKGLYVSNPALNSHTAEREMLLPAGSTFKYIGSTTVNLPHYDYSGNKVGPGGPVTMHQVEIMQPGSPEFESQHPRGEGGKFVAKPGTEAEADAKQVAQTPPKSALQNQVDILAGVEGLSPADKIAGIKTMLASNMLAPSEAQAYAQAKIDELEQELAAKPAAQKVPPEAVQAIVDDPDTNHNQKLTTLQELKWAAEQAGHDPTEIDLGTSVLEQKQKDLEQNLPMPDGTAVQQEMWEAAAAPAWKHETKVTQLESDIANAGDGPTKEYGKQLLAHLKGEEYSPPVPQGPVPYPGAKGQQAIYEYATMTGPAITTQEKIDAIKSVMSHVNAGPNTQAFGEQWINALGGDPSVPAPAAAPTPTPAAKPKPVAAKKIEPPRPNVHGDAAKTPGNIVTAKMTARTKNAIETETRAKQPKKSSSAEAKKVMPSLKSEFWNDVPWATKSALSAYKGVDYHSINGSLRGDPSYPMTDAVQEKVNAIDDQFYRDETVTTEDMIVRRGEQVDKAVIDKWRATLAAGKEACLYPRTGYTSASVADEPAFSHMPVWFHFVVPKGHRVLGIAGTVGHDENEVLLPHGQQTEIYEIFEAGGRTHVKVILR